MVGPTCTPPLWTQTLPQVLAALQQRSQRLLALGAWVGTAVAGVGERALAVRRQRMLRVWPPPHGLQPKRR